MMNPLVKISRKCRRILNQTKAFDYPETAVGWKKYEGNPILQDKVGSVFDPYVCRFGNAYIMCVSRRANHSLAFYESSNGIEWKNSYTVLEGLPGNTWEAKVNRATFLKHNGLWYLWYTGQTDNHSAIGLAISEDGHIFKRVSKDPVIRPDLPAEGTAVMNPCVIWDASSKLFKMWYAAGENYEPDVIMYAESADGILWEKRPEPVMKAEKKLKYQQYKVGACDIAIMRDGTYRMAYIGYQNVDVARVCLASSMDGIHWVPSKENPIISPGKGKWDSDSVYKPTIEFTDDRTVRVWYNGRSRYTESIGLAMKEMQNDDHQ